MLLDREGLIVKAERTPLLGGEYNRAAMLDMLLDCTRHCLMRLDAARAVIERQQAMPGQGRSSAVTIGYGYGLWLMALTSAGIPFDETTAQKWQYEFITRKPKEPPKAHKERLLQAARQQFPGQDFRLRDGRADAALIALWGHRHLNGGAAVVATDIDDVDEALRPF
ncbi:MAG: hypothetical protein HY323_07100 [Betaproteobacteria bacterium]|nr:hypothetical protein [Betaproteobacteria bacterium]